MPRRRTRSSIPGLIQAFLVGRIGPPWAGRLVSGLLVAAIALLLVEAALRLALGNPAPPVRVVVGITEMDSYLQRDGDRVLTTYQPPSGISFPARLSGPRVAVLGASSVHGGTPMGAGVSEQEIWDLEFAGQLEQITGIPTLNLGRSGASSRYLVAILEELLEYSVTTVVVYSGHCEIGNVYFEKRYSGFSGFALKGHPALERLQLFGQLRRLLEGVVPNTETAETIPDPPLSDREIAVIESTFRDHLERIVEETRKAGVRLVLVSTACDLTYPPVFAPTPRGEANYERWSEGMALRASEPRRARELLEQARDASLRPVRASTGIEAVARDVGAQPGVRLVVAQDELPLDSQGAVLAPWLFADELHLSRDGHRAMAELLAPVILEETGYMDTAPSQ
jgi:hypothetical protein